MFCDGGIRACPDFKGNATRLQSTILIPAGLVMGPGFADVSSWTIASRLSRR